MLKYLWVHPGLNEITDSFRQDFSEPLKCQRRLSIEQRKVSAAFPRFLAIELPLLFPWSHLAGHPRSEKPHRFGSAAFHVHLGQDCFSDVLLSLTEINPLLVS